MTEQIEVKQDGAVLEIVFARPDKKNAIRTPFSRGGGGSRGDELSTRARKTHCVAQEGGGGEFAAEGDAFTAGNDLADFASAAAGKADLAAHDFIEALGIADKLYRCASPGACCRRWHKPCSCIVIAFIGPKARSCRRRLSIWHSCRKPHPACCCQLASDMPAPSPCLHSAKAFPLLRRSHSASPRRFRRRTKCCRGPRAAETLTTGRSGNRRNRRN